MNNIFSKLILSVFFLAFMPFAQAQGSRAPLEEVINAIKANRVQDMNKYFDDFVPVTINNNQSNYSHNQAEAVLRDFFDKNPCKDLKVTDSGSPDGNSRFAIGNITTPNGKYTLYVLMKMKGSNFLIKEIRLNKD